MKNVKVFIQIIKKLNEILELQQKKRCIMVFGYMLVGAFLETLGVSAIVPFVQALLTPEKITGNKYVQKMSYIFHIHSTAGTLMMIALFIVAIYFLKNGVLLFSTIKQVKFRSDLQKYLSIKILNSYMKRPYEFFINTNSAEVMRAITSDTGGVYQIVENTFKIAAESITLLLIAIYVIASDPFLAIGMFIVAGVCVLLIVLCLKGKMNRAGIKQRIANTEMFKAAHQAVDGIKDISVMQRREPFVEKFEKAYEDVRKTTISYSVVMACPERIVEAIFISSIILLVTFRIQQGIDASSYVPQLAAFAIAAFRILPSISKLSSCMTGIVFYKPSLDATYDTLKEAHKYDRTENANHNLNKNRYERLTFNSELHVHNISWKYVGNDKNILNKMELTINKGDSVAFIGESGAGKTTLADVILGLLRPYEGKVMSDGKDIYDYPLDWSSTIGYVPQTIYLIDDTIRNNIAFGLENVDDNRVWSVLKQAQLYSFVKSLENGLDTIVGERGVKFSGGQRQRIAIARALYYDPEILVLDEATAALDNETERAVMEAIDLLQGKKTLIIVAHRLSTIKNCNKIYEIKDGNARLIDPGAL